MQKYDSDETFCSQAESEISNFSASCKPLNDAEPSLRRSQRLSQQSTKNYNEINESSFTCTPRKKRQKPKRSKNSTQFCTKPEIAVCSQNAADDTQNTQNVLWAPAAVLRGKTSQIKFESIDLMADLESQTLSSQIPSNQNHLQYETAPTPQAPSISTAAMLTQNTKSSHFGIEVKQGQQSGLAYSNIGNKSFLIQSDKNSCNDSSCRSLKRKSEDANLSYECDSQFVEVKVWSQNPSQAKKLCLNNNNRQVSLSGEPGSFINNEVYKMSESWKNTDCESSKYCGVKKNSKKKKSETSSNPQKRRTKKRKRNIQGTNSGNLTDSSVDKENEPKVKMIEMNVRCPTRLGNYVPPPPMVTKPVPLLRSVANSILPKVYPPHFVDQKPPIDVRETGMRSIDYDISQEETYPSTSGWRASQVAESPTNNAAPFRLDCTAIGSSIDDCAESRTTSYLRSQLLKKNAASSCSLVADDYEALTSSSPSLPDSLKGIFDSDDLREILNVGRIEYKLRESHVKALSVVLDVGLDYLRDVIQHVVTLDESVLKKLEYVMAT